MAGWFKGAAERVDCDGWIGCTQEVSMLHPDVDYDALSRLMFKFCMPFGAGFIMLVAGVVGLGDPLERAMLPLLPIALGVLWMATGVLGVRAEYVRAEATSDSNPRRR
jgi:hypothetical protein